VIQCDDSAERSFYNFQPKYIKKIGSLEEHFCKVWMLFSWKISKTCLGQLESKTPILDFGTLQKVTTFLQKLFRTLRRTHLPCLVTSYEEGLRTKIKNVSTNQSHGGHLVLSCLDNISVLYRTTSQI
jgi:hypothetical protein